MSASNSSNIPSGNAAKASSVGANTVNVPSPERVSTNPAASRAATKVLKPPATATSAIDCCSTFSGYGVLFSIIFISSDSSTIVVSTFSSSPQATNAKASINNENVRKKRVRLNLDSEISNSRSSKNKKDRNYYDSSSWYYYSIVSFFIS